MKLKQNTTYTPAHAARALREAADDAENENYHELVTPLTAADSIEALTERTRCFVVTHDGSMVFTVQP